MDRPKASAVTSAALVPPAADWYLPTCACGVLTMRGLGACRAPGQSQIAAPCHERVCDTALHPCLHRRDACCSQGGVQDWPMCVGGRCTRMDVHPGICCLHRVAGSWRARVLQAGGDTATPFTASRCGAAEPPHKTRKTPFGTGTVCGYQGVCNSCKGCTCHLGHGAGL